MTRHGNKNALAGWLQLHARVGKGISNTLTGVASPRGEARYNPGGSEPRCETTCHCERRVVPTTWDRIYNGVGETCGHPACHPPADT